MIVLLDTSHDLTEASAELGCDVEQLFTPLTRFRPQDPESRFAIDNGAFAGFQADAFTALLYREEHRRQLCRWVAVPDVVGSARRTREVFERWYDRLSRWPLAYVCQDGQEDMEIPWDLIQAVFIGGSTAWKMGPHAAACVRAAKALGKWAHFGRVNTPSRFEYAERIGCDSIDGTGLSRYSWMRERIHAAQTAPGLFGREVEAPMSGLTPGGTCRQPPVKVRR
jgi:hypothetical protein